MAVRLMVWEVKVNREAGAPLWVFSTRQSQETRRGQGAYSVHRSHLFKRGRSIPLEHTTTNQDLQELLETEEAEDSEHPPAGPQQGNQQRYPQVSMTKRWKMDSSRPPSQLRRSATTSTGCSRISS